MRRDPNAAGESFASYLGATLGLIAGIGFIVALASLLHVLIPGGIR